MLRDPVYIVKYSNKRKEKLIKFKQATTDAENDANGALTYITSSTLQNFHDNIVHATEQLNELLVKEKIGFGTKEMASFCSQYSSYNANDLTTMQDMGTVPINVLENEAFWQSAYEGNFMGQLTRTIVCLAEHWTDLHTDLQENYLRCVYTQEESLYTDDNDPNKVTGVTETTGFAENLKNVNIYSFIKEDVANIFLKDDARAELARMSVLGSRNDEPYANIVYRWKKASTHALYVMPFYELLSDAMHIQHKHAYEFGFEYVPSLRVPTPALKSQLKRFKTTYGIDISLSGTEYDCRSSIKRSQQSVTIVDRVISWCTMYSIGKGFTSERDELMHSLEEGSLVPGMRQKTVLAAKKISRLWCGAASRPSIGTGKPDRMMRNMELYAREAANHYEEIYDEVADSTYSIKDPVVLLSTRAARATMKIKEDTAVNDFVAPAIEIVAAAKEACEQMHGNKSQKWKKKRESALKDVLQRHSVSEFDKHLFFSSGVCTALLCRLWAHRETYGFYNDSHTELVVAKLQNVSPSSSYDNDLGELLLPIFEYYARENDIRSARANLCQSLDTASDALYNTAKHFDCNDAITGLSVHISSHGDTSLQHATFTNDGFNHLHHDRLKNLENVEQKQYVYPKLFFYPVAIALMPSQQTTDECESDDSGESASSVPVATIARTREEFYPFLRA